MRTAAPTLAILLLGALASGCCSAACRLENAPNKGVAGTPEDLVRIVQHLAKNECWSELYDFLSEATRAKFSRLEWRLGIKTIKVPGDEGYRVVDIMEKGEYIDTLYNPDNAREAFLYMDYQEPPKKKLHLKLLILRVAVEQEHGPPRDEWRVGMWDQELKVEAGDRRYWWN